MAARLSWIAAGSFLVLLLLSIAGNMFAIVDPALPIALGEAASKVAPVVAAADQAVAMLFTIVIGMFAIVGLLLREATERPLSIALLIGPTWFFVLSVSSLYFGFLARLQVLQNANYTTVPFRGVMDLVGWQGTFVALAVVPLVMTVIDLLVIPRLKGDRR